MKVSLGWTNNDGHSVIRHLAKDSIHLDGKQESVSLWKRSRAGCDEGMSVANR